MTKSTITITPATPTAKLVIERTWHDLSPKLLAFLATGLTGTLLINLLGYVNVHISNGTATLIVLIVSTVAGYLVKEASTIDAGTYTPGTPAVVTSLPPTS